MKRFLAHNKLFGVSCFVLALALVIVSSFVVWAGLEQQDQNSALLGYSLGESQQDSEYLDGATNTSEFLLGIHEDGSLDTENLILQLLLKEEVVSVRMTQPSLLSDGNARMSGSTTPSEQQTTMATPEELSIFGVIAATSEVEEEYDLGISSKQEEIELPDGDINFPSVSSYSLGESEVLVEEAKTTRFELFTAGVHTFDLLDEQGNVLETVEYETRGGAVTFGTDYYTSSLTAYNSSGANGTVLFEDVGQYKFQIFGNSNVGGYDQKGYSKYQNINMYPELGGFNSTSMDYTQEGSQIKRAFLYVGQSWFGNQTPATRSGYIMGPNGGKVQLDDAYVASSTGNTIPAYYYDITDFMRQEGSGTYYGVDINCARNQGSLGGAYDALADWEIIVIEEDSSFSYRQLLLRGFSYQMQSSNRTIKTNDSDPSKLLYPPESNATGQYLVSMGGGNTSYTGDQAIFYAYNGGSVSKSTILSEPSAGRQANDFFCGVISQNGVSVTTRNPYRSPSSNVDLTVADIPTSMVPDGFDNVGLLASTGNDRVYLYAVGIAVDIGTPDITGTTNQNIVDGQGNISSDNKIVNIALDSSYQVKQQLTDSTNNFSLSDVVYVVTIPAGLELDESSIVVSGSNPTTYTYDASTGELRIPVDPINKLSDVEITYNLKALDGLNKETFVGGYIHGYNILPDGTITTQELDIALPGYRVNPGYPITVQYVDESGAEIEVSDTLTGAYGDTYTTTEKSISGYEVVVVPSNETGTFSENPQTVTYVYRSSNTVEGAVQLSKAMVSGEVFLNNADQFKVKISGEGIVAGTNDVFTLSTSGTVDLPSLIAGKTYTLSEINLPTGYKLDGMTATGVSLTDNGDGSYSFVAPASSSAVGDVQIVVTNEWDYTATGAVQVNKSMLSGESFLNSLDSFTVKISGTGITAANETWNVGTTGNVSLPPLVAGQTYTLSEINLPTGYQLDEMTATGVSLTDNGDGSYSFVAPASSTPAGGVQITVTNRRDMGTAGAVKITKAMASGETFLNGADIFEITLTGAGTTQTINLGTLGGWVNLPALVAGQTYKLSESSMPVGYQLSGMSVDGVAVTANADGTYSFVAPASNVAAGNVEITVTNKRDMGATGAVQIKKEMVSGQSFLNSIDSFMMKISGAGITTGVNDTINVVANGTGNVPSLVAGQTYTISEINLPTGYKLDGMTAAGVSLTDNGDGSYSFVAPASNTSAGSVKITVTNQRDMGIAGAVKITKAMASGENFLNSADVFVITLVGAGTTQTINLGTLGGWVNLPALVAGQTYKLSESSMPVGYQLSGMSVDGVAVTANTDGTYSFVAPTSNAAAGSVEITVTNKRDMGATGAVQIKKEMVSGQNFLNSIDSFQVKISGDGIETGVNDTINIVAGGTANVPSLVSGKTYTISEINLPAGYQFDSMSSGDSSFASNGDGTYSFTAPSSTAGSGSVVIVLKNKLDTTATGAVQINKSMFSGESFLNSLDSFMVKISGTGITTANETWNVGTTGNVSLPPLVVGQTYTLSEINLPTGYKLNAMSSADITLTDNGDGSYSFVAPASSTPVGGVKITVTNQLDTSSSGVVKVRKAMVGGENFLKPEDTFTLELAGPNITASNNTVSVGVSGTVTLPNLVAGATYTITEKTMPSGYQLSGMSSSNTTAISDLAPVAGQANQYQFTAPIDFSGEVEIIVTNQWKKLASGSIGLEKEVTSGAFDDDDDVFKVKILGTGVNQEISISVNTPATLPALVVGETYIVEESTVGSSYLFESMTGIGITLTPVSGSTTQYSFVAPSTVAANSKIVVTNDWNLSGTQMKIKKVITDGAIQSDDTFDITISGAGINASNNTIVLETTGTQLLPSGLVPGQIYTLKESVPSGYQFVSMSTESTSINLNHVGAGVYQFTAPNDADASAITISVTNKRDLGLTGAVKVKKVVTGGVLGSSSEDFTLTLSGPGIDSTNETILINSDGTLQDLPALVAGESYTLTETTKSGYVIQSMAGSGGITLNPVTGSSNSYTFVAPASSTTVGAMQITVTNQWDSGIIGAVQIKKAMKSGENFFQPTDQFTIQITGPAGTQTVSVGADGNWKDFPALVAGQIYTISEINLPAGYKLDEMTAAGTTLTDNGGGVYQFTAPASNSGVGTIKITVTNKWDTGSRLKITKKLAGTQIPLNATDSFDFTVSSDTSGVNDQTLSLVLGSLNSKNDTLTGLIPGHTYTIEESIAGSSYQLVSVTDGTGVSITGTQGKYSFTMPSDGTDYEIVVTNQYNYVNHTNLTIAKEMKTGQVANPANNQFDILVTPANTVLAADQKTFTLTPGGTAGVVGTLVAGEKYYISEDSLTGYELDAITATGLTLETEAGTGKTYFIAPETATVAEITVRNKLSQGAVQISKKISGTEIDTSDEFTFVIWPDGSPMSSGVEYTTVNRTVKIETLYGGQKYNIKEVAKDYYTFQNFALDGTTQTGDVIQFIAPSSSSNSILIEATNKVNFLSDDSIETTVKKSITGEVLSSSDSFQVVINGPNMNNKEYTISADETPITIDGLLSDALYTITEKTPAKGYLKGSIVLNGTVLSLVAGQSDVYEFQTPAVGAVANDLEFVVNNTNQVLTGNVRLNKVMEGGSVDPDEEFEFTIWRKGTGVSKPSTPNETILLTTGNNKVLTGLIAGQTYYIEEANTAGYELVSVKVNGTIISKDSSGNYSFVAPDDNTAQMSIEVTNKISKGKVTVQKVIVNNNGNKISATDTFDIEIWPDSDPSNKTTYTIPATGSLDITSLNGSQKYWIQEIPKTYYTTQGISVNTVTTPGSGAVSFIAPQSTDNTVNLVVQNAVNLLGNNQVNVAKAISTGSEKLNNTDSFEIVVNGPNVSNQSYFISVTGTPVYLEGLVEGASYSIYEKAPTNISYQWDTITSSDITMTPGVGTYEFTAPNGTGTASIVVQNKNTRMDNGKISLLTQMKTGETAFLPTQSFDYKVWRAGTSDTGAVTYTNALSDGHTGPAVSMDGLIPGQKYYISEQVVTGYVLDSITINGNALQQDSVGYYFTTPSVASDSLQIVVTQRLNRGTVQLQKVLDNGTAPLQADQSSFSFYIWPTTQAQPTQPTHTVSYGQTLNLSDLYGGVSYNIVEEGKTYYSFVNFTGDVTLNPVSGLYEFTVPLATEPSLGIQAHNTINFLPDQILVLEKNYQGEVLGAGDQFELILNGLNQNNQRYLVPIDGTSVYVSGLVADAVYTIQESEHANKGYQKDSIGSSDSSVALTQISDEIYQFTAPTLGSVAPITITANNSAHLLQNNTVTVQKVLKAGQQPIDANDSFDVMIWRDGAAKPASYDINLQLNTPASAVPNMIAGQKYYIEEQSQSYYRLSGISVNGVVLQNDANGYYFISPENDSQKAVITISNELDYLPEGAVGLVKEMGYDEDGNHYKPLKNNEVFHFTIWRDGTEKPTKSNYSATVYHTKPEGLKDLIAGFKYYIDEDSRNGYLLDQFHINGIPLQKDDNGYFFIAPANTGVQTVITAVNNLDELPDGTLLVEKVMTEYQQPLEEGQRFQISVSPADRSSGSGTEKYTLRVNGDREELVNLTAGGRYYVLEEAVEGYQLDRVLYDGTELDRDDTGYYFIAPVSGELGVITVVNRLSDETDGTLRIVKYIDNKPDGAPDLPEETFIVKIEGPDNLTATASIDSTNGQVTWTDAPTSWTVGDYRVTEILKENSAYSHRNTSILVNGETSSKEDQFSIGQAGDRVEIRIYNQGTGMSGTSSEIAAGIQLPDTGGFPIELLGIVGLVLISSGIILFVVYRVRNKKEQHK